MPVRGNGYAAAIEVLTRLVVGRQVPERAKHPAAILMPYPKVLVAVVEVAVR